jgi:hypothetical protein
MPIFHGVAKHLTKEFKMEQNSISSLSPVTAITAGTFEGSTHNSDGACNSKKSISDCVNTQEMAVALRIPPPQANATVPEVVCCIKQCKFKHSTEQLRRCASHPYGCTKFIHSYCYGTQFIVKSNLEPLVDPTDNTTYCACSKRCYNKVKTAIGNNTYNNEEDSRSVWGKDGREGPEDINNSMKILLDLMTENHGSNYIKFCGKNNNMSKQATAEIVAKRINALGVRVKRTAKQLLNKIYYLEQSFRTAHDFANSQTGAGLIESDNEETFKKLIEKKYLLRGTVTHYGR